MEGASASLRYGLAGLAAGATTGWATDKVYGVLLPYLAASTPRGSIGQSAVTAVVGGALVSVMIYAGDVALESVIDMGRDPLFRQTFYQAAFLGSSTARTALSSVQQLLGSVITTGYGGSTGRTPYAPMPVSSKNPVVGPGPVEPPFGQLPAHPASRVPTCGKGTQCGAIML